MRLLAAVDIVEGEERVVPGLVGDLERERPVVRRVYRKIASMCIFMKLDGKA
jgi:hypothetical protein